jgi:hypothetical protein
VDSVIDLSFVTGWIFAVLGGNDHRQRLPVYTKQKKTQAPFPDFSINFFLRGVDPYGFYRKITNEIDFSREIFFWKNHKSKTLARRI